MLFAPPHLLHNKEFQFLEDIVSEIPCLHPDYNDLKFAEKKIQIY